MVKFKRVKPTKENMKVLRDLQKLCLPADRPYDSPYAWYWLGFWGQTPVAFCIMSPSIRWSNCVYLARSGVAPEFQGQGLQKKMILIREKWARKHKYEWAITDTTENPQSANSLISRGYKVYEPKKPWGLRRAIYWRKKL